MLLRKKMISVKTKLRLSVFFMMIPSVGTAIIYKLCYSSSWRFPAPIDNLEEPDILL
jgi:hypothetical protein